MTHRGSGNQESNERKFVQDNDSDDEEGDGEDYQCGNDEVRFIIIDDTNIIKVIIIVSSGGIQTRDGSWLCQERGGCQVIILIIHLKTTKRDIRLQYHANLPRIGNFH